MDEETVVAVRPERAAFAGRIPARIEHEVLDNELVPPRKQVGQRLLAVGSFEDVVPVHALPRQLAPLAAELIAQFRELLLLGEQPLAGLDPLVTRDHGGVHHGNTSILTDLSLRWAASVLNFSFSTLASLPDPARRSFACRSPQGSEPACRTAAPSTCCSG